MATYYSYGQRPSPSLDGWWWFWMLYDDHMITGDECGPNFLTVVLWCGRRMIGIFRSLIWSKTPMELIFNRCGEFRWSLEGLVSQIHSPHLHGVPGIFVDLLRSVQMLKKDWGAESNGKLPYLSIPSKTATLIAEFAVEDLPLEELELWFLSIQWKTCPWTEHFDDDEGLKLKETPEKISTKKLTRPGIEPRPAAWEVTMLR